MNLSKLKDKSWLWCHQAGSHNGFYNLPADSTITPADAGAFLSIDRFIYVCLNDQPQPPFQQHAGPLRNASALVWSIVGDSSSKRNDERSDLEAVIELKSQYPNLVGGIMDDFFCPDRPDGKIARWDVESVASFQNRMHKAGMDLWVVVYDLLLGLPVQPWLEHCDVITYWTWQAKNLHELDDNFKRLEKMAPHQRKLLGCYMWDYGSNAPLPLDMMKWQCTRAAQWLNDGRIDGVVFLASNLCDLNLDAVLYVKELLR